MNCNKKQIIGKLFCYIGFLLLVFFTNTPIFYYMRKLTSEVFYVCNFVSLIGIVFCLYILVKKSCKNILDKRIIVLYIIIGGMLFISSIVMTDLMIPLCQSDYEDAILGSMVRQAILSCSLGICGLICFRQIKEFPDNYNAVVMLILCSNSYNIYNTHGSLSALILLIFYSLFFLVITLIHLHIGKTTYKN